MALDAHAFIELKYDEGIAVIHQGRLHACDTLDGLREATGKHYLEDIFVHLVQPAAAAQPAASAQPAEQAPREPPSP